MTAKAQLRNDLDRELHDLCQPLTTASCHLELGQMLGDAESMKAAVDGALIECRRTFTSITHMRKRIVEILGEAE